MVSSARVVFRLGFRIRIWRGTRPPHPDGGKPVGGERTIEVRGQQQTPRNSAAYNRLEQTSSHTLNRAALVRDPKP